MGLGAILAAIRAVFTGLGELFGWLKFKETKKAGADENALEAIHEADKMAKKADAAADAAITSDPPELRRNADKNNRTPE